ncbi:MAG: HAMP domain-containing histidine kinase [Betaproteobacteria bacterium]|nr:HAMP domain-containing histidine kinase [Betaproteobacteria bacterium]
MLTEMENYTESPEGADAGALMMAGHATLPQPFIRHRAPLFLGLMLLALHASLAFGVDEWWSRAFLLAHFGFFLIWQPVWLGDRQLDTFQGFVVVGVGLLFVVWSSWWLMALWIALLFALIGGNVAGGRKGAQRAVGFIAALYLLALLLMWVVPHLFEGERLPDIVAFVVRFVLPLLLLALLPMKVESDRASEPLAVDLLYSVLLFLLVTALVLGSFVLKVISRGDYPSALAQTLFVIALVLLVLSWLWNPHGGFSGVKYLVSRYFLTIGLPFEVWMRNLAEHAQKEPQPARFLTLGLEDMAELPWVAGVGWRTAQAQGQVGTRSKFHAQFALTELDLDIYTHWSLSPALTVHLKLLAQLLGYFYEAKQREQQQRQSAYHQAIFETGARLTHDVKNLLQSLKSLCSAVEHSSGHDADKLQALMQRQLPQIAQRLQATLDKLRAPSESPIEMMDAAAWWEQLKQRYADRGIEFTLGSPGVEGSLPGDLFSSVAENLLENALFKAKNEAGLRISAQFASAGRTYSLRVCDDGSAIRAPVAESLFGGAVKSQTGLGIGLYQAARQAERLGYRLALTGNERGRVCFELAAKGQGS